MRETRALGIKWPQWYTLMFEEQVTVDMRVVCPQNVQQVLLYEVKKKDEEKRKEEEHHKLVSRIVACVEGGTGFLHTVTKPTAWREGIQILEEEDEDVRSLARCEEKRTEWAQHWQHNTDVQDLKDKLWRNEELKS